jgi:transposase
VLLTGGQADDGAHLLPVLGGIRVARLGRGRPRTRPARLLADKGYSYPCYRRALRRRKLAHLIPERADHRRRRAHRAGRPPAFDAETYTRRNVVERCFNRLKQFRAIATRYDKTAAAYHALVLFAAILLWTGF